ncbi:UbiH/UbiF family hydroxylase [Phreatobacter sp.]|uniref:UbiH/UbiF family hydroxylase n=1 Tax=Phreatobacter sp. TaxID=1966341 RepID=UPI003F72167C
MARHPGSRQDTGHASKAVVVGGGPAGLFAALALHRAGARVEVVAPAHRPGGDRRTSALLGGSVDALRALGVWERVCDRAAALAVMRLVDDTGRLIRAPLFEGRATELGLEAFGYNIANDDLNGGLSEAVAAAGIPVHTSGAAKVLAGATGAEVVLADGDRLVAALVVGADGRRSLVREAAGISVVEERYPQVAVTANLSHTRAHDHVSTEFHTPDGPFTLVPLPGRRSSLVWVVRPAEAERLMGLEEAAFARAVEKQSQGLLGRITVETGRGAFPLGVMTPRRFAGGRIALVGEAAHVVPPIGAQGLNLGLRDGAALADCIADALSAGSDIGGEALAEAYDRSRRADIVSRSAVIHMLNRSLLSDFLPFNGLRSLGLWALDQVGPLRRTFMREGLEPSLAQPRLMRGDLPTAA